MATDANYDKWLVKVDALLGNVIGLGINDLGDADYHDEFDAGTTPKEMAGIVLDLNDAPYEIRRAFE